MFIRKPGWLKTVALITCVTFIFSDTVRAEFAAASPNNPAPAEAFSAPLEVPAAFGELSRAYRGAGDELVVLIQDAHANFEAQKNISSILGHLLERHGVRWIGVEGAQGYLAASFLSSYPNRGAVETVARQFMQDAKLSGPEYAAVAEHPELLLYGVEEDGLYRQNRAVFIEALDYKGRDEELVAALRNLLLKIAKKIFSPELYELVTRSENFRRENKNLIAYLGHLQDAASRAGLDTARYPQIVTFIELNEIHRALDSEAVQKEVRHLRAALGMKAKEREAGMDEAARLWEKAKGRGLDVSAYRQAALAAKSFELQKKIDVGLFDEIDSLDRALRDRLLRTDEERALEKQFKVLEIAGKIFNFELSRDDAEFFFAHREDFRAGSIRSAFDRHRQAVEWNGGFPAGAENLDQDLARIEKFYALALERDQVLVERTLSEMRARGEKRIALVAGGFHTAGFERALRQRNISFMTFSPAITQIGDPEKQARLYEDSVKQAPEALAGLLAKLYFPQKGGRINDPRYQLSAHKILLDELGLDELKVVLEKGDRSLDLARLIEENPAVGANLVLSLLTSLVDMDENREAFDAAARLRDILSKFPPEEARLVEFFYPFLDADTEIGVGKQGEVLVIGKARTEAPSLVATIEMVREGGDRVHSPRLSNLARKGAVISQIAGQRLIVQMLAPMERELALLRLQAGARPRAAALGSDALPESEAKRKLQALEKKIRPALAREGVNLRVLRSNLEKGIEEVRAARGYQARRNDFDALLGGLDTAVFDLEAADYRAKITSLREELAGLSGGLRASLDEMDPAQRDRYQNLSRRIDRLGLLYDSVVIEGLQKAEAARKTARRDAVIQPLTHKITVLSGLKGEFSANRLYLSLKPLRDYETLLARIQSQSAAAAQSQDLASFKRLEALIRAADDARRRIQDTAVRAHSETRWSEIALPASRVAEEKMPVIRRIDAVYEGLRTALEAARQAPTRENISALRERLAEATALRSEPGLASGADYMAALWEETGAPAEAFFEAASTELNYLDDTRTQLEVLRTEMLDRAETAVSLTPAEVEFIEGIDGRLKQLKERINIQAKRQDPALIPEMLRAWEDLEALRGGIRTLLNQRVQAYKDLTASERQKRESEKQERERRLEEIRQALSAVRTRLLGETSVEDLDAMMQELYRLRRQLPEGPEFVGEGIEAAALRQVLPSLPDTPAPAVAPETWSSEAMRREVAKVVNETAEQRPETASVRKRWVLITAVGRKIGSIVARLWRGGAMPERERAVREMANEEVGPAIRSPLFDVGTGLEIGPAAAERWKVGPQTQVLAQRRGAMTVEDLIANLARSDSPAKGELIRQAIRQWVQLHNAERLGEGRIRVPHVDLDTKFANDVVELGADGKFYFRTIDNDDLTGLTVTSDLSAGQFLRYFHYFWFAQAYTLRALGPEYEQMFREELKAQGLLPERFVDDPAAWNAMYDAMLENYQYDAVRKKSARAPRSITREDRRQLRLSDLSIYRVRQMISQYGLQDHFEAQIRKNQLDVEETAKRRPGDFLAFLVAQTRSKRELLNILARIPSAARRGQFDLLDEEIRAFEQFITDRNLSPRHYLRPLVARARRTFDAAYRQHLVQDIPARLGDLTAILGEVTAYPQAHSVYQEFQRIESLAGRYPQVGSAVRAALDRARVEIQTRRLSLRNNEINAAMAGVRTPEDAGLLYIQVEQIEAELVNLPVVRSRIARPLDRTKEALEVLGSSLDFQRRIAAIQARIQSEGARSEIHALLRPLQSEIAEFQHRVAPNNPHYRLALSLSAAYNMAAIQFQERRITEKFAALETAYNFAAGAPLVTSAGLEKILADLGPMMERAKNMPALLERMEAFEEAANQRIAALKASEAGFRAQFDALAADINDAFMPESGLRELGQRWIALRDAVGELHPIFRNDLKQIREMVLIRRELARIGAIDTLEGQIEKLKELEQRAAGPAFEGLLGSVRARLAEAQRTRDQKRLDAVTSEFGELERALTAALNGLRALVQDRAAADRAPRIQAGLQGLTEQSAALAAFSQRVRDAAGEVQPASAGAFRQLAARALDLETQAWIFQQRTFLESKLKAETLDPDQLRTAAERVNGMLERAAAGEELYLRETLDEIKRLSTLINFRILEREIRVMGAGGSFAASPALADLERDAINADAETLKGVRDRLQEFKRSGEFPAAVRSLEGVMAKIIGVQKARVEVLSLRMRIDAAANPLRLGQASVDLDQLRAGANAEDPVHPYLAPLAQAVSSKQQEIAARQTQLETELREFIGSLSEAKSPKDLRETYKPLGDQLLQQSQGFPLLETLRRQLTADYEKARVDLNARAIILEIQRLGRLLTRATGDQLKQIGDRIDVLDRQLQKFELARASAASLGEDAAKLPQDPLAEARQALDRLKGNHQQRESRAERDRRIAEIREELARLRDSVGRPHTVRELEGIRRGLREVREGIVEVGGTFAIVDSLLERVEQEIRRERERIDLEQRERPAAIRRYMTAARSFRMELEQDEREFDRDALLEYLRRVERAVPGLRFELGPDLVLDLESEAGEENARRMIQAVNALAGIRDAEVHAVRVLTRREISPVIVREFSRDIAENAAAEIEAILAAPGLQSYFDIFDAGFEEAAFRTALQRAVRDRQPEASDEFLGRLSNRMLELRREHSEWDSGRPRISARPSGFFRVSFNPVQEADGIHVNTQDYEERIFIDPAKFSVTNTRSLAPLDRALASFSEARAATFREAGAPQPGAAVPPAAAVAAGPSWISQLPLTRVLSWALGGVSAVGAAMIGYVLFFRAAPPVEPEEEPPAAEKKEEEKAPAPAPKKEEAPKAEEKPAPKKEEPPKAAVPPAAVPDLTEIEKQLRAAMEATETAIAQGRRRVDEIEQSRLVDQTLDQVNPDRVFYDKARLDDRRAKLEEEIAKLKLADPADEGARKRLRQAEGLLDILKRFTRRVEDLGKEIETKRAAQPLADRAAVEAESKSMFDFQNALWRSAIRRKIALDQKITDLERRIADLGTREAALVAEADKHKDAATAGDAVSRRLRDELLLQAQMVRRVADELRGEIPPLAAELATADRQLTMRKRLEDATRTADADEALRIMPEGFEKSKKRREIIDNELDRMQVAEWESVIKGRPGTAEADEAARQLLEHQRLREEKAAREGELNAAARERERIREEFDKGVRAGKYTQDDYWYFQRDQWYKFLLARVAADAKLDAGERLKKSQDLEKQIASNRDAWDWTQINRNIEKKMAELRREGKLRDKSDDFLMWQRLNLEEKMAHHRRIIDELKKAAPRDEEERKRFAGQVKLLEDSLPGLTKQLAEVREKQAFAEEVGKLPRDAEFPRRYQELLKTRIQKQLEKAKEDKDAPRQAALEGELTRVNAELDRLQKAKTYRERVQAIMDEHRKAIEAAKTPEERSFLYSERDLLLREAALKRDLEMAREKLKADPKAADEITRLESQLNLIGIRRNWNRRWFDLESAFNRNPANDEKKAREDILELYRQSERLSWRPTSAEDLARKQKELRERIQGWENFLLKYGVKRDSDLGQRIAGYIDYSKNLLDNLDKNRIDADEKKRQEKTLGAKIKDLRDQIGGIQTRRQELWKREQIKRFEDILDAWTAKLITDEDARRAAGIPEPRPPRPVVEVAPATRDAVREGRDLPMPHDIIMPAPDAGFVWTAAELEVLVGSEDGSKKGILDRFGMNPHWPKRAPKSRELYETGRLYGAEHWGFYVLKGWMQKRNMNINDPAQRLAAVKLFAQAQIKVRQDLPALRVLDDDQLARYRQLRGASLFPPEHLALMEIVWNEQGEAVYMAPTKKKEAPFERHMSFATVVGMIEEQMDVLQINSMEDQLSQLRLKAMRDRVRNNFNVYLDLLTKMRLGQLRAEWAYFISRNRPAGWLTTPQGQFEKTVFEQGIQNRISRDIAVFRAEMDRGRDFFKIPLANYLGYANFEAFLAHLNARATESRKVDPYLDLAFMRVASQKGIMSFDTEWQLMQMLNGKAPFEMKRSGFRVLSWYVGQDLLGMPNLQELATKESAAILTGVNAYANQLATFDPANKLDLEIQKLTAIAGGDNVGESMKVIIAQHLHNLVNKQVREPLLNNALFIQARGAFVKNINETLGFEKRRVPEDMKKYYEWDAGVVDEMALGFMEHMLLNGYDLQNVDHRRKLLEDFFLMYEKGLPAVKDILRPDYGRLVDDPGSNDKWFMGFLTGSDKAFKEADLRVLRSIVQDMVARGKLPPEDQIELNLLLNLLDEIQPVLDPALKPAARQKAAQNFIARVLPTLQRAPFNGLAHLNNPADAEAALRNFFTPINDPTTGQPSNYIITKDGDQLLAAAQGRARQIYGMVRQKAHDIVIRDVRNILLSAREQALKDTRPLVDDGTRDGRKLYSAISLLKMQPLVRQDVEFFLWGPDEESLKPGRTPQPKRSINLNDPRDVAQVSRIIAELEVRNIRYEDWREVLQIAAGKTKKDGEWRWQVGADKKLVFPFKDEGWELFHLLNGRDTAPKKAWPLVTDRDRRNYVGFMISEAEKLVLADSDPDYRRDRKFLADYLREDAKVPDKDKRAVPRVLAAVDTTVNDLVDALRGPGAPALKRKAATEYSELSPLKQAMMRAILEDISRPGGGSLDMALKRLEALSRLAKSEKGRKHLTDAIPRVLPYYRAILGPSAVLPSRLDAKDIISINQAFSLYVQLLSMPLDPTLDLRDEAVVERAITQANADLDRLVEHFNQFPGDRDTLMSVAFEKWLASLGKRPRSEFQPSADPRDSAKRGRYADPIVDRDLDPKTAWDDKSDQWKFEQFQRQIARLHLGSYVSVLQEFITSLPGGPVAPAVAPVGVAVPARSILEDVRAAMDPVNQERLDVMKTVQARLQGNKRSDLLVQTPGFDSGDIQELRLDSHLKVQREAEGRDADSLMPVPLVRKTHYGVIDDLDIYNPGKGKWEPATIDPYALLGTKKGQKPSVVNSDTARRSELISKTLAAKSKATGIQWLHRTKDQVPIRLELRGQDAALVLTGAPGVSFGPEFRLGMAGEGDRPYRSMRVHTASSRVDPDGKFHLMAVVDGAKFSGILYLKGVIDESKGDLASLEISADFKTKTGVKDEELNAAIRGLTMGVRTNPEKTRQAVFHFTDGKKQTLEIKAPVAGERRDDPIGKVNTVQAISLVGAKGGTSYTIELLPVPEQRYSAFMVVTDARGSEDVSHGVVFGDEKQNRNRVQFKLKITATREGAEPDVAAVPPAGWPLAAPVAPAERPLDAEQMAALQRKIDVLQVNPRYYNEGLKLAHDQNVGLLGDEIFARKLKPGEEGYRPNLTEYQFKDPAEEKAKRKALKDNGVAEAFLRGYFRRVAELVPNLDAKEEDYARAWDTVAKQTTKVNELLTAKAQADKRKASIALVLYQRAALTGDFALFDATTVGQEAVDKLLAEARTGRELKFFGDIIPADKQARLEEELAKVQKALLKGDQRLESALMNFFYQAVGEKGEGTEADWQKVLTETLSIISTFRARGAGAMLEPAREEMLALWLRNRAREELTSERLLPIPGWVWDSLAAGPSEAVSEETVAANLSPFERQFLAAARSVQDLARGPQPSVQQILQADQTLPALPDGFRGLDEANRTVLALVQSGLKAIEEIRKKDVSDYADLIDYSRDSAEAIAVAARDEDLRRADAAEAQIRGLLEVWMGEDQLALGERGARLADAAMTPAVVDRIAGLMLQVAVEDFAAGIGSRAGEPTVTELADLARERADQQAEIARFTEIGDRVQGVRSVYPEFYVQIPAYNDPQILVWLTQLERILKEVGPDLPFNTEVWVVAKSDQAGPVAVEDGRSGLRLTGPRITLDVTQVAAANYSQIKGAMNRGIEQIVAAQKISPVETAASLGAERAELARIAGEASRRGALSALDAAARERFLAALDGKDELSQRYALIQLLAVHLSMVLASRSGNALRSSMNDASDIGLYVVDTEHYDVKGLVEKVETLLNMMPNQHIAIPLDALKISAADQAALIEQLRALNASHGNRVHWAQKAVYETAVTVAQELGLTLADTLQFAPLDAEIVNTPDYLDAALLSAVPYVAGRVVFFTDDPLALSTGRRVDITLGDLVRAWQLAKEAEAAIARAA